MMQPPPRKVRVSQEQKQVHGEQINRLQLKHQSECELLEDLRAFSQKRAAIEREYAQALHKLANQYLKREWSQEPSDHRNMFCVWRAYLEGTVQLTQSRINSSDIYKTQVSDPAKSARLHKEHHLRKCVEQLTLIQAELQESVKELTKSRKKYQEAETMAQAVRDKAEFEAKSKLSLFQSRSSLQRASVKLKAKRTESNCKATQARNDYILTLAAANAHQQRYYNTDLIYCIQVLDGKIHNEVKEYLVSLCRAELETYEATHSSFSQILASASAILQQFHQEQFVEKNPIFQRASDFLFQPNDSDTVMDLQRIAGSSVEHILDKEARKWSSRVAREYKSIVHTQKVLEEYGVQDSQDQSPDLDTKVEVARQSLRRAETVKAKAEARLDVLRCAGVAVETWLKSAMNQVMEELENERWNNLGSSDAALSGTADLEREDEEEEMEDSGEILDDSSSSPSSTLRNYPLTCRVLYSYKASQPDELTIEEQEVLEVIDDGDMEDWVKARNHAGQVGYVPEKYLQLPSSSSLLTMLQTLASLDARSHSSSNSTEPEMELHNSPANSSVSLAKALYDYCGQTSEELSFPEGAVIRILSRDTREDDGFWKGEFNGAVGVFPAVLVEDLTRTAQNEDITENGEAQDRPQASPSPRSPFPLGPLHFSPLQTPTSPSPQPSPSSGSPIGRPPSYNSHNGHPQHPRQSPFNSPVQGSAQPPKYPESPSGSIRPVRAAPPPPKQHPRGQVKRREEVEITLV